MSGAQKAVVGTIGWIDLTVDDATRVRDFYAKVVGWTPADVPMGDYNDFNMVAANGHPAAGVCHRRGSNANLPPQWLIYIHVADLDASLAACTSNGGALLHGPVNFGGMGRYAVIRDPAGAVAGLFQAA